jgi:hypothetical protein
MQLKFKRFVGQTGTFSKKNIWTLHASVQVTPEEKALLDKYQQWQSNLAIRAGEESEVLTPPHGASLGSLIKGQQWENENLHKLINVENIITAGAQEILGYVQRAETFNGRETVFEVSAHDIQLVAQG